MTATSKRALLVGAGLVVLLVAGLVVALTLAGDDGSPTVMNSPTPPDATPSEASPTPTRPKAEVRAAYLEQWDVYADAVRTLQTDRLEEVFTDEALAVVRKEIGRRRRTESPARVRVEHDLAVKIIDATTAVVDDRYINHSVTIDPETGKPTERDPNEIVHEVYTLKKVNGIWKVSAIVRQSVRPNKG